MDTEAQVDYPDLYSALKARRGNFSGKFGGDLQNQVAL
jgi:hypothetical protein